MENKLVIDKEEVVEMIEKGGNNQILVKLLESSGKDIVDARIYYFTKDDTDKKNPKPTGKGLWLDPETALLVGMAMVDAAEKVMKRRK